MEQFTCQSRDSSHWWTTLKDNLIDTAQGTCSWQTGQIAKSQIEDQSTFHKLAYSELLDWKMTMTMNILLG